MAKRIKKAAVRPELCKQWLRRFEEDGESPPQIAEAYGYDVRTVRKQIEQARQEREMREARVIVLHDALEKHYKDLYTFAERLDSSLPWHPKQISPHFYQDRMWQALREHLPRSPIWKAILRCDQLADKYDLCVKQIEERAKVWVHGRGINFAHTPGELGLVESFGPDFVSDFVSIALGQKSLDNIDEISHRRATDTGLHDVSKGRIYLGLLDTNKAEKMNAIYRELVGEAIGWEQYFDLQQIISEYKRQSGVLHDELATIILRRVIPGRCRYCPI